MGRPLHPWEIVTLDQLSEPARLLITKMARKAAQDFFEEQRQEWLEKLRAEVDEQAEKAARRARARYLAEMDAADAPLSATNSRHLTIHDSRHLCANGSWQNYCRKSCSMCCHPERPVPCEICAIRPERENSA